MSLHYKNKSLFLEDVDIEKLAEKVKTPVFIYSRKELLGNYSAIEKTLSKFNHVICFAVKSNSNLALLHELAKRGCGADIVSGGELYRALKAGISPKKIVYSGVGKTEDEISYALESKIKLFNIESLEELMSISRVAKRKKRIAPIAIRINPDIEVDTHHHVKTGKAETKFGINFPHVLEAYVEATRLPNLNVIGVHMHIGSQIKEVNPYVKGIRKLMEIVNCLSIMGIQLKIIDIGGGFGIAYSEKEKLFPLEELSKEMAPLIKQNNLMLIVEPGRFISGPSGILVTRVIYCKNVYPKNFIIVDAAMNDLVRPSLYDAYHAILPLKKLKRKNIVADVVGPVCETGDYIAKNRTMAACKAGEYIAVKDAGAYGFSMSSNYNSRTRAAEVMVSGSSYTVVRKRETYSNLIEGERFI
ncbi:MAG: diaminopimelate decarboxylase [bacterium]